MRPLEMDRFRGDNQTSTRLAWCANGSRSISLEDGHSCRVRHTALYDLVQSSPFPVSTTYGIGAKTTSWAAQHASKAGPRHQQLFSWEHSRFHSALPYAREGSGMYHLQAKLIQRATFCKGYTCSVCAADSTPPQATQIAGPTLSTALSLRSMISFGRSLRAFPRSTDASLQTAHTYIPIHTR